MSWFKVGDHVVLTRRPRAWQGMTKDFPDVGATGEVITPGQVQWDHFTFTTYLGDSYFKREDKAVGTSFRRNDIVCPTRDTAHGLVKGTLGIVSDDWANIPQVTFANGTKHDIVAENLNLVPGTWVAASGKTPVVEGSIVRLDKLVNGRARDVGRVFFAQRGTGSGEVALVANDSAHTYLASNFSLFVPKQDASREARAMTYETALTFLPKFIALGHIASVRGRSWDKQGRYAAVVVEGLDTYYKASECEATLASLASLEAAQTPIDVVGSKDYQGRYLFDVGGRYLMTPAKPALNAWTEAEITEAKGLVRKDGKKYRLCREVKTTVPFVS